MEVDNGRVILPSEPLVEVMSVADRGRDQYKPVLSGCGLVVEKCHAGFERPSSGVVGDVVNLVKYEQRKSLQECTSIDAQQKCQALRRHHLDPTEIARTSQMRRNV